MADLAKEMADLKLELEEEKKTIKEQDVQIKKANSENEKMTKEFADFKTEALKEIEAAQKAAVVIISDKVIEHDGKKYEFTISEFGVIGVKGRIKSSDIIKEPAKHKELLDKLIEMKSGILKELVIEKSEEN